MVDVVSKYAGAALPEQARRYVKQSILGLPVKWASAIEVRAGRRSRETSVGTVSMGGVESELGTPRPDQRMHDPHVGAGPESAGGKTPTQAEGMPDADMYELSPTEDAADRVLTFAVESLDMLRAVTGIFGESIEKAEAFVLFPLSSWLGASVLTGPVLSRARPHAVGSSDCESSASTDSVSDKQRATTTCFRPSCPLCLLRQTNTTPRLPRRPWRRRRRASRSAGEEAGSSVRPLPLQDTILPCPTSARVACPKRSTRLALQDG